MAVSPTPHDDISRRADPDARLRLYELDCSVLFAAPRGTGEYMHYFVGDADVDGAIFLDGVRYDPIPIQLSDRAASMQGASTRPKLSVANPGSIVSALIRSMGGDLTGAHLTIREIYRRHLDDGTEPDPLAQSDPQSWRIEQTTAENRWFVEFELAAPFDVEGVQLPARRVEYNMCQWEYKDSRCKWVPVPGLYFDEDDQATDLAGDRCGLRITSCKLRFGGALQSGRLRFGAFPGAARTVK